MTNNDTLSSFHQLTELISSYMISQCVFSSISLGLFDALKNEELSCKDIASKIGVKEESLHHLLMILKDKNLIVSEAEKFGLSSAGRQLSVGGDYSLRNFSLLHAQHFSKGWGNLTYSLRNQKSGFLYSEKMMPYQAVQSDKFLSTIFNNTMDELSALHDKSIIDSYVFPQYAKIIDIGGGQGNLLLGLLICRADLTGVLAEKAYAINQIESKLDDQFSGRLNLVTIDFFSDQLDFSGDIFIMKNVINDWDDNSALHILNNCRRTMKPGAKLLVIQHLGFNATKEESSSMFHHYLALQKLVMRGGSAPLRTKEDMEVILHKSLLKLTNVIDTDTGISILEAEAV